MRYRVLVLAATALLLGASGCDDTAGPDERVVGEYVATTLIISAGGAPVDALAQGARVELSIMEDGTTDGLLFVPGGNGNGVDANYDLTGTWETAEGRWLILTLQSQVFLHNRFLEIGEGRLTRNADGIELVLTKT